MSTVSFDFHGEGVVITGAATSVGRAMATAFGDAGAKVHICDVDGDALEKTLEELPGLTGSVTNVGDPDEVEQMASDAIASVGHVDVLINNVGIAGPAGPIEELDIDEWRTGVDVNLHSMFFTAKQFVPAMKEKGQGVIINFSTVGTQTLPPFRANYAAAKCGVEGLTGTLARELGPFGIRCNAIRPGGVNNERLRKFFAAIAERDSRSGDELLEEHLQYISMRTLIEPSELADAAMFQASPGARHITGQKLAVDGGVQWDK